MILEIKNFCHIVSWIPFFGIYLLEMTAKLIGKKVNHVAKCAGSTFVEFGVSTLCARNGCEFFVLHIKNFGKGSTCCPHFIGFVVFVAAFRANVFLFSHDYWFIIMTD